ncbi:MAG: 50S ribosomal protein L10 [Clostridia bacterium]|nr:50S ribosomal protein L10 [Clostridia bacterium]
MSTNLEAKKVVVEEIKNKIKSAKSVAFVDYHGLTVDVDFKMRKAFRENGSEYKVYKNRLILRALNDLGITGCDKFLEGNTAVAFSNTDETSAPKIVMETVVSSKKMQVKFGVIDGKVIGATEVEALAKLPSKETLIAMLLGTLQAPARNMVYVLSAPARGLAVAMNAIATK